MPKCRNAETPADADPGLLFARSAEACCELPRLPVAWDRLPRWRRAIVAIAAVTVARLTEDIA